MFYQWKPYVPVAARRAKAKRHATRLAKKGRKLLPVEIDGRTIARTFWGRAWCDNLECYSDFENRLPRGRTYVRNGSVMDLQIERGSVTAIVSGSDIYNVKISINPLQKPCWKKIQQDCSRSIDSLIDLLQGRFSKGVMERLTRQEGGLFPKPKEIKIRCSCPDWAVLCKHAAAVLYGVGARLDSVPEMLFELRGVDHLELIGQAVDGTNLAAALSPSQSDSLAGEDLGAMFGIELDVGDAAGGDAATKRRTRRSKTGSLKTAKAVAAEKTKLAKRVARSRGGTKAAVAKKPAKTAASRKKKSSTPGRSKASVKAKPRKRK